MESANRDVVEKEAGDLIERLNNQGLHVLIDAPKPVFKSPPFKLVQVGAWCFGKGSLN